MRLCRFLVTFASVWVAVAVSDGQFWVHVGAVALVFTMLNWAEGSRPWLPWLKCFRRRHAE